MNPYFHVFSSFFLENSFHCIYICTSPFPTWIPLLLCHTHSWCFPCYQSRSCWHSVDITDPKSSSSTASQSTQLEKKSVSMPSVEGMPTFNYFIHSPYWKAILYYSLHETFGTCFLSAMLAILVNHMSGSILLFMCPDCLLIRLWWSFVHLRKEPLRKGERGEDGKKGT